jgi:hypothetical protein
MLMQQRRSMKHVRCTGAGAKRSNKETREASRSRRRSFGNRDRSEPKSDDVAGAVRMNKVLVTPISLTSPHDWRGVYRGGELAETSQFSIIAYERRPGVWRAAIMPVRRSGVSVLGKTTQSIVTPDDFDTESGAMLAAEKIVRTL